MPKRRSTKAQRSTRRQRTTPSCVVSGPLAKQWASSCCCSRLSRRCRPGALRSTSPSAPAALKRCTRRSRRDRPQGRSVHARAARGVLAARPLQHQRDRQEPPRLLRRLRRLRQLPQLRRRQIRPHHHRHPRLHPQRGHRQHVSTKRGIHQRASNLDGWYYSCKALVAHPECTPLGLLGRAGQPPAGSVAANRSHMIHEYLTAPSGGVRKRLRQSPRPRRPCRPYSAPDCANGRGGCNRVCHSRRRPHIAAASSRRCSNPPAEGQRSSNEKLA